jgi:hypothetical protein
MLTEADFARRAAVSELLDRFAVLDRFLRQ